MRKVRNERLNVASAALLMLWNITLPVKDIRQHHVLANERYKFMPPPKKRESITDEESNRNLSAVLIDHVKQNVTCNCIRVA